MRDPSKPLVFVKVTSPVDPAIDLKHPDAADACSAYQKSRSAEDLAKIPVLPGADLTVYTLEPLTLEQHGFCERLSNPADKDLLKYQAAFAMAWTETRKGAVRTPVARIPVGHADLGHQASKADVAAVYRTTGSSLFREAGALVIQRSEGIDGETDPFALPPGVRLGF